MYVERDGSLILPSIANPHELGIYGRLVSKPHRPSTPRSQRCEKLETKLQFENVVLDDNKLADNLLILEEEVNEFPPWEEFIKGIF